MNYFKDTKNRPAAALLERETKRNQSRGNARDSNPLRSRSQRNDRDLVSGPLWGFALVVALVVTATLMAQPRLDPLQKMLDAIGGREALLALHGFSYESVGERFETGQGLRPATSPIKASSFRLAVLADVERDRVSFDWQRQIFDPLRGKLAYRDVIDGDVGYQTGNDSVFNPPDARSDRALPSERIGALRREFRLLNPHMLLRAVALDEGAAAIKADVQLDGRRHHVIEVFDEVRPVELFVDAQTGQLSKLETVENDHIWGDVLIEVTYLDWSTPQGSPMKFPHQVELALAGTTLRTAVRSNVVVNPGFRAEAFALPDEPRTEVDLEAAERAALSSQYIARWHAVGVPNGDEDQTTVVATPVAGDPDVLHLSGGFHHSLAVRFGDGIVVVEPPLNEARSKAVLKKLDELWPGVPVSHLILTHHHFDHMGGIRTYAARGATIVTSELNRLYVEQALLSSHTVVPDELANIPRPSWQIEQVPVVGGFSLVEGGRSIKLHHIPTVHNEDMLVVYLPKTRLLFESDVYVAPGMLPPHQPLPAPFSDWAQGLLNGLVRLDWRIDWIAGGHGGVVPFTDLHSHYVQ